MIYVITGIIKGQKLQVNHPSIVSDTINYLTAKFFFPTDDWDGLEKWAHFRQGKTIIDIKLTDDKILPSDSLNLSSGVWELKIHGNAFENGEVKRRITTEPHQIYVKNFGEHEGEPFPDSPPTPIENIYAQLAKLKEIIGDGPKDGATFTPHVSDDGVISWTNNNELKNPPPVDIKGEEGKTGYSIYYSSAEILQIARTIPQDTVTVPEDREVQINDFIITANGWLCQITDIDTEKSKYKITALLMLKGYTGEKGEKGDPYTLTEEDKKSITDAVIAELPTYNGEVIE